MKFPFPKLSIVAVLLVCAGLWWWLTPTQSGEAIKYYTQPLSKGDIESTVNSSGTISPVQTVQVGSELSGLISELNVDFNDTVKSGEVIARIDDRTVRSRLKQAEADLASANATLAQQNAGLMKAQMQLDLAKREYDRKKGLLARKMISDSELDIAKTDYDVARVGIVTANAAIQVAKSRVQQSQASLDQVKLDLDRTYIRSPVDGVVIDRQVDKGQAVSASLSAPTLFSIAEDLSKMQIEADVDEADIGRIKQGMAVKFSVDAYPNRKFVGSVSQVRKSATVTNNVVAYKVIISLDNKDLALLPGMTANVDVILGERRDVLRVPNSALRFKPASETQQGDDRQQEAADRFKQLVAELQLTADQQSKFKDTMQAMQKDLQAMRDARKNAIGPPADLRQMITKMRAKTESQLRTFLTPDQMSKYQQRADERRKAYASRDQSQQYQRGTVYVLKDGVPHLINVRVGIADMEYSEIVSNKLHDGDVVVVRAQRIKS